MDPPALDEECELMDPPALDEECELMDPPALDEECELMDPPALDEECELMDPPALDEECELMDPPALDEECELMDPPALDEECELMDPPALDEECELMDPPALDEECELMDPPALDEECELMDPPALDEECELMDPPALDEECELMDPPALDEECELMDPPALDEECELMDPPALDEECELMDPPALDEECELMDPPALDEECELMDPPALDEECELMDPPALTKSVFHGLKRNIGCFYLVYKSLVKYETKEEMGKEKPKSIGVWPAVRPFVNGGASGMLATCVVQLIDMIKMMESPPTSQLLESDESAALESKKMSHNMLMVLIKFLQKKRYSIIEKAIAEGTEEVVSDAVGDNYVSYDSNRFKKSSKRDGSSAAVPTSFGPIIEMAMTIVEKSGGQYHVLLIITDGQVTRSVDSEHGQLSPQGKKTVEAIVTASKLPLSIILVGVGDGPWDMMREFDDNIPARAFDNFQFVNFTEIMSKNVAQSRKETEFALAALMEIPSQYKATIELNILGGQKGNVPERVPLPPPVYSAPSFSSSKSSCSSNFQQSSAPYHGHNSPISTAPPASSSTFDNQIEEMCRRMRASAVPIMSDSEGFTLLIQLVEFTPEELDSRNRSLNLQAEESKFVFEAKTIQRMELLNQFGCWKWTAARAESPAACAALGKICCGKYVLALTLVLPFSKLDFNSNHSKSCKTNGKHEIMIVSKSNIKNTMNLQSVDTPMESHDFFTVNPQTETQTNNPFPDPSALDEECELMDSTNSNDGEQPVLQKLDVHSTEAAKTGETHEVLKPIAVHSKSPINVDELVGISKLNIGESFGDAGPSPLPLKLLEGSSSRQSSFQANPGSGSSRVNLSSNPIHAV
ncbi:hypothetical protein TEA_009308 [Camellia sinensis var. sinensis]|uniref:Copine C-terminal domain-containing protein n=1 Tax=Camellia sinensis var. sinensis TaxID=542762 RepID=A0A4S4DIV0_CAMSN|nr:hypothetical protein TEA_009308 [Camellia sinensis var. sinensis]